MLTEREKKKLQREFDKLLKQHKIKVRKWSKKNQGLAYIKQRQIEVPKIVSIVSFMIGLHELIHVIYNLDYKRSRLTCEFKVELLVIKWAKRYNLHKDYSYEFQHYINHTIKHLAMYCNEENKFPKYITNWMKQNENKYKKI